MKRATKIAIDKRLKIMRPIWGRIIADWPYRSVEKNLEELEALIDQATRLQAEIYRNEYQEVLPLCDERSAVQKL